MSKKHHCCCLLFTLLSMACSKERNESSDRFDALLSGSPSIAGTETYLYSPYVTAGDRVYMVGHQDGSFPEIGWHIKG